MALPFGVTQGQIDREIKMDKGNWGDGPWQEEPNYLQWKTACGLPGLIVRNHAGALCGYAGVSPDHPLYGVKYSDVYEQADIEVHGGLTYSDSCTDHICHEPEPGEPDDVWWFGFDCAHAGDYAPAMDSRLRSLGYSRSREYDTYRDVAYVREQVESLAEQLKKVE